MKVLNLNGLQRVLDRLRRSFTTDTLETREVYTGDITATNTDTDRLRTDCISDLTDEPIEISAPGLVLTDTTTGGRCTLSVSQTGALMVNGKTVSTTIGLKG